jgi:hypothetical protein
LGRPQHHDLRDAKHMSLQRRKLLHQSRQQRSDRAVA